MVALLWTELATVALRLLSYDLAGENAAMVLATVFTIKTLLLVVMNSGTLFLGTAVGHHRSGLYRNR